MSYKERSKRKFSERCENEQQTDVAWSLSQRNGRKPRMKYEF